MRWLALVGLVIGIIHLARRRLDAVEVRGRSMVPTLLPGDRIIVIRAAPRAGDVVLASDPRDPRRELVKRVGRIDSAGIHLRGDNVGASTDARTFGALDPGVVKWRAVLRYWPARRMGRI